MPFKKLQNHVNLLRAELRSDLRSCTAVSAIVLSFLLLSGCSTATPEADAPLGATANVVYAIKDIPENKEITLDAVEQRELEEIKIPEAAIYKTDEVVGKISKYGICKGQIICTNDLLNYGSTDNFLIDLKKGYGQKIQNIAEKKKTTMTKLATDWLNERIEKESSK
ncbi:MAG: SAF domain-containing protein [Candidatus Melainabacteria bacterium]|nr:SAF domain-containing protein [Candidatus Melainabacteria bacterium]